MSERYLRKKLLRLFASAATLSLFSGCVPIRTTEELKGLREMATERLVAEHRLVAPTISETPQAAAPQSGLPESGELSSDALFRLALDQSPRVQKILAALGEAEAERVQAQLIANPLLNTEFRFGDATEIHLGLSHNLFSLFSMSARSDAANSAFAVKRFQAFMELLRYRLALDAGVEDLVFAEIREQLSQDIAEAEAVGADFQNRQRTAGNVTASELLEVQAKAAEAKLEALKAKEETEATRSNLKNLLGFSPSISKFVGRTELPETCVLAPAGSVAHADLPSREALEHAESAIEGEARLARLSPIFGAALSDFRRGGLRSELRARRRGEMAHRADI